MATPRAAIGTLLKKAGTTVALVGNIDGPAMKGDTIDVTNHDNTDNYKEFIVGLKEGGDLKFHLYFDGTEPTHTGLIDSFEARTVEPWSVTLPNANGTWSFGGVITGFNQKYDVNGAQTADCTIKVSGRPTFA